MWHRLVAIIKYEGCSPYGGTPPHSLQLFRSFSVLRASPSLRGLVFAPESLRIALEGFCARFVDIIAPGGFLEHLRASAYVFQCKHGMTAPQTCDSVQGSAWVPTAASLPSALLIVNLTTRSQRGCERLVKSGRAAFPS